MPNGITMIESFRIRTIASKSDAASRSLGNGGTGPEQTRGAFGAPSGRGLTQRELFDILPLPTETGAMIELLEWPGAPPYVATLATVRGVVRDPDTKELIAGANITFANTPYRATADSLGAFSLVDVLPGTYDVYTDDPTLDPYGASAAFPPPRVVHPGSNDFGEIPGETPAALVKKNCVQNIMGRLPAPALGTAAIFGLVKDGGSHDIRMEIAPTGGASLAPLTLTGRTDPYGRFRVCGLPPSSVSVLVDSGKSTTGHGSVTITKGSSYELLPIELGSRPPL
jgi:hypothetical protein